VCSTHMKRGSYYRRLLCVECQKDGKCLLCKKIVAPQYLSKENGCCPGCNLNDAKKANKYKHKKTVNKSKGDDNGNETNTSVPTAVNV
ncbi:hypothetical protein LCGC14_1416700, partial [marine sediment metagenome]